MVYPSGEVETAGADRSHHRALRSGWFIHPGKLKLERRRPRLPLWRRQVPDGLSIRGS